MPKDYKFVRRGKTVIYTAVENGVAVRLPPGASPRSFASQLETKGAVAARAPLSGEEKFRAQSAGWIVTSHGEVQQLSRGGELGDHEVGVCVRDGDGRLCFIGESFNIKFSPGDDESKCRRFLDDEGLAVIRPLRFGTNLFQVRAKDHRLATEMVAALEATSKAKIEFAEPVVRHTRAMSRASPFKPADPGYAKQWQWDAVWAEDAWNYNKGTTGKGMRIAVVDRGFHWGLKDLKSQTLPISGVIDEMNPFKLGREHIPPFSHGTFAAAQAAAKAGMGSKGDPLHGCGMAPDAELLLVCIEDRGDVTQTEIARAIGYAANPANEDVAGNHRGADVLTCAEGPPESIAWELEGVLEEALIHAEEKGRNGKGMPIFWAVSNAGRKFSGNGPGEDDEVASHDLVIAVGCFNEQRKVSHFSSYGDKLACVAPGERVYNINGIEGFAYEDGTSFAAPIAAGIGALVLQTNPELSAKDVRAIMRQACEPIMPADRAGAGRINAYKAVQLAETWPVAAAKSADVAYLPGTRSG